MNRCFLVVFVIAFSFSARSQTNYGFYAAAGISNTNDRFIDIPMEHRSRLSYQFGTEAAFSFNSWLGLGFGIGICEFNYLIKRQPLLQGDILANAQVSVKYNYVDLRLGPVFKLKKFHLTPSFLGMYHLRALALDDFHAVNTVTGEVYFDIKNRKTNIATEVKWLASYQVELAYTLSKKFQLFTSYRRTINGPNPKIEGRRDFWNFQLGLRYSFSQKEKTAPQVDYYNPAE